MLNLQIRRTLANRGGGLIANSSWGNCDAKNLCTSFIWNSPAFGYFFAPHFWANQPPGPDGVAHNQVA